jgi:hypothetical protein
LESRGVETRQENIQCLNSDAHAGREEMLNINAEACGPSKKEKSFPHSPGGECQKVSFVALDQLSENTQEDESKDNQSRKSLLMRKTEQEILFGA